MAYVFALLCGAAAAEAHIRLAGHERIRWILSIVAFLAGFVGLWLMLPATGLAIPGQDPQAARLIAAVLAPTVGLFARSILGGLWTGTARATRSLSVKLAPVLFWGALIAAAVFAIGSLSPQEVEQMGGIVGTILVLLFLGAFLLKSARSSLGFGTKKKKKKGSH